MKIPTLEMIVAMTTEERRTLHRNASKLETEDARVVVKLITENRLLATVSGGLPHEDPVVLAIESVIASDEGRAAAKEATDSGLPAMAGVDPLLRKHVGEEYGTFDTTSWAGTFVAGEMESMGYKQTRKKALPPGSVAKTAAFFERRASGMVISAS